MKAVYKDNYEKQLLDDFFRSTSYGIYVDIGGNTPLNSVSTQFHEKGWKGLIVEPIPENVSLFLKAGRSNIWEGAVTSPGKAQAGTAVFHIAGGEYGPHSSLEKNLISPSSRTSKSITVNLSTVNKLMKEYDLSHIDFLSIDTEGTEVDVLRGTDLQGLNVRLALIEDWARDFSIHSYMRSKGYKLVRRTGFNSWYVKNGEKFPVSIYGYLQLFRKYILGMPARRLRHWRHERMHVKNKY